MLFRSFLSQPALSQYIRRVERELEFPLYERTNGKCILTEAGKVMLEKGKVILEAYEEMMEETKAVANMKKQTLHFGCPTGYSVPWFSEFLYHKKIFGGHPTNMIEDSVEYLLHLLLKKNMDILFIPAIYHHPEIVYHTICREEFYLAVPKNHGLNRVIQETRQDGYVALKDLDQFPFISGPAKAYTEFLRPLFDEAGIEPNIVFVAKNWDIAHALVEKGIGLTMVPFWLVNHESDSVQYYRLDSAKQTYRIFAYAILKKRAITKDIKEIIDYIIEKCGDSHAGELVSPDMLLLSYDSKANRSYETE